MKPSKSSHKPHKSSRSSPLRKEHLMKKARRSRSPLRMPGSSRSMMSSPAMKRSHAVPVRKGSHSPRLRSIASSPHRSVTRRSNQGSPISIDRIRSIKRPKFEKRKNSPSPVGHHVPVSHEPPASLGPRSISPYHGERYLSSRSAPHYDPATKKKLRREPERFHPSMSPSVSPPRPHTGISLHSEGHLSRRHEGISRGSPVPSVSHSGHHRSQAMSSSHDRSYEVHGRARPGPPAGPSGHSSETHAVKVPFNNGRDERYRSGSPDRYASEDKRFAPTLHERFSSVVETNRSEPQVRYSREDLEKITIDIRRNLRDQSPTLRRIMNPSDVKLVRRANEGHRPIFDREEIKQAPRDLREDAHYERKLMSGGGLYNSAHSMDLREVENYEITRHRFDTQHALFSSSSGRTLSDRWQNPELRKESTSLDRDERKREYEMSQITRTFVDLPRSRSRSGDRDFRSERYGGREPIRSRPPYPEGPHRVLGSPPDPREPIPIHHKSSIAPDSRRKLAMKRGVEREHIPPPPRSDSRSRFRSPSERRYPESFSSRERHHSGHHSPGMEFHKLRRSRSRSIDSKLPDFSRRPDKYNYKPWIDKPDLAPRGPSYFEHDNREGSDPYRGRGSSRPFRSLRGFRSRGFRGLPRGSMRFRGSFRGYRASSTSPRGRGVPRRGRFSPGLWEHDLYSRSSQDRKSGSLL